MNGGDRAENCDTTIVPAATVAGNYILHFLQAVCVVAPAGMFHSSQLAQVLQVEEFEGRRRTDRFFRFFDCGRGCFPDMVERSSGLPLAA
jgi:hypothetical protein